MINFAQKPLFLAPLAGFSDIALRGVAKKFGCDVTISEMINANALIYDSKKTLEMIKKNPAETPYIVQIAGADTATIKKAVEILNEIDGIDGIDLNCGCPVPKVVRQNAGAALLNDPALLCKIIETIKKTSQKRYTSAKIRLGFSQKMAHKIAKNLENAGLDFLSVHGRTRAQGYSGNADYTAIAEIKNSVKIPVIANGDINAKNATEILEFTRCDGLMIGRASIGQPWIFWEIKGQNPWKIWENSFSNDKNLTPNSLNFQNPNAQNSPQNENSNLAQNLKKIVIKEHFAQMIAHYGESGVAIFRKHLHEYSRGKSDASTFRNAVNHATTPEIMSDLIEQFF